MSRFTCRLFRSSTSIGHASHLALKTGERAAFSARKACINGGYCSASGMESKPQGLARRSTKAAEPSGSYHGTTRTGSSAEHSTDHSASMVPLSQGKVGPGLRVALPGPTFQSENARSEEHTSELQSLRHLVCR